jgi:hypothetical protein
MNRVLRIVLVALAVVFGSGAASWGASDTAAALGQEYFHVEWRAGQARGHPVVSGYVYNDYGEEAQTVQLQIGELNSSGQVIGKTFGRVDGGVPAKGRSYFELAVPAADATYRVTVRSFDFVPGVKGP